MEKGKGKVKSLETEKYKGIPYRSRLISLQLDEHMFRGPGEVGENSLIRLFNIKRAAPKPETNEKPVRSIPVNTTGPVKVGGGGFPQIHSPSFFTLTTFAYARRDMTMDEAVRAGELTRNVTMPAIGTALLPYAVGVGGSASLYLVPTVSAAGAVGGRYALTQGWRWYAAGMTLAGAPLSQNILNKVVTPALDDVYGDGSPGYTEILQLFFYSSNSFAQRN